MAFRPSLLGGLGFQGMAQSDRAALLPVFSRTARLYSVSDNRIGVKLGFRNMGSPPRCKVLKFSVLFLAGR